MVVDQAERVFDFYMVRWRAGHVFPIMLEALCHYVAWTDADQCFIRIIEGESATIAPMKLNRQQRMLIGTMMHLAALGKPIRVVILKARKMGCTTLVQTFCAFICAHYKFQVSVLMSHLAKSTDEIFDIAKLIFEQFTNQRCTVGAQLLRFPNTRSRYSCHTVGGQGAGAGGSPTLLHVSETALCEQRVKKLLFTAVTAIPDHPATLIVQESTARGRDEHWNLFDAARLDKEHPYASVFLPWFLDDRLTVYVAPGEITELDEYEQWLLGYARDSYGIELTMGAIKWRREKIKLIPGGLSIFRQEYPATPEEAVQGRADLILPNIREAVIDKLPFEPHSVSDDARVGGCDFGYNDPTVVGTGYYVDQVLYVTQVGHYVHKLARDHAKSIVDGHRYFCDPSALQARKEVIKELGSTSAMLLASPRMVDKRFTNTTNDAEWEALRKGIVDGKVKILKGCAAQIVLEGENFEWDEKTGKPRDSRNPNIWWHFDTLDMLRYMYVGCLLAGQRGGVVIVRGNY